MTIPRVIASIMRKSW